MQKTQIKFTYRDYTLLPEQDRRELIDGEFYEVPAPSIWHQDIVANLGMVLRGYVKANNLGKVLWAPCDLVLSEQDVVQPDLLFVSNERSELITKDNIRGGPDLVVEVLSPSTASRDRELKLSLYAANGVREYWIVDPDARTVQVLALARDGSHSARTHDSGPVPSAVLPDLTVDVGEIFEQS